MWKQQILPSEIVAMADDLTGALEIGAKFAGAGIPAVVTTCGWAEPQDTVVQVLDTETRHLPPAVAAAAIRELAGACRRRGVRLLYKKTDSTLRGAIGAELEALSDVYPEARLVYAPAYPAMGRTVRDGRLHVHGVPVEETEFARDALNPVADGRIRLLFSSATPIEILDGETDQDVRDAAARLLDADGVRLAAGPAALAGQIAALLSGEAPQPPERPQLRNCLVVNGSRHPASAGQVRHAEVCGFSRGAGSGWTILDAAGESRRMAALVRDMVKSAAWDGLVVFGGDTAFAIVEALGHPLLRAVGEVAPGVPVASLCFEGRELWLITKAGGFGERDVLTRIRDACCR